MTTNKTYDTIVLGAGAAGLFYAGRAGQRGRKVLVLDHAKRPADKVRISGGGRCNFTNLETVATRFISQNPHFAKSALARYTPWDFISLMGEHGLTYTEKHKGELFCDQKSGAIIEMLLAEVQKGGGDVALKTHITKVHHSDGNFIVETDGQNYSAMRLIVATGGLSIPKMGASGLAYDIARQFGHDIIETRPGLVPYTFSGALKDQFAELAGAALPVRAEAGGAAFDEDLLFTHRGLSGPAALQTSSYWTPGEALTLSLSPQTDWLSTLQRTKQETPKMALGHILSKSLPGRFVRSWLAGQSIKSDQNLAEVSNEGLSALADRLQNWSVRPTQTEGYRTAEVTVGGVCTSGLSQKTMESKTVDRLFFIGECVDVTGWLGGYNFQWAWASAAAAAGEG